jgi:uncharacterized membrane protein YeaQ/YmgE (transglycosylase-associated protein family)
MGILVWIIVGLITGWLAWKMMRAGGYGLIGDVVVGVVGGLLGGVIGTYMMLLGKGVNVINLQVMLVSFAGAVILLAILRFVRGGKKAFLK